MVNTKKLLALAGVLVLLVGAAATTAWALNTTYNRPNPLMDYVPQERGIYDGEYQDNDQASCRSCHGNSLADRHHLTETVTRDHLCTPCHDLIPNPPGVVVYRNCVDDQGTYGCHNWSSVLANGWHHDTDFSHSENCTTCHNPNLIEQISPFRSLELYPPSVVTPTPWSCENCHWEQAIVDPDGDPNTDTPTPGHPSTYDHYNIWNQGPTYFEYGKAVKLGFYTHHFGTIGNVWPQCGKCHGMDPNDQSYDPYNPELIRYCQLCHSIGTLHTIPDHVQGTNGWEATGFHVGGGDTPTVYRSFTADEMCFGCHADLIPDPPVVPDCTGHVPAIAADGMEPISGACTTIVTLRGTDFGPEQVEDGFVQMRLKPVTGNPWVNMPIYSWTDTQIEFEIPCEGAAALAAGNYQVRVNNACGHSPNSAHVFSLKNWGTVLSISPATGPCDTWVTLTGSGFGTAQEVVPDPVTGLGGIHRCVDFASSEGTYTAKQVQWTSDTQIRARFYNMFKDGIDPTSDKRNFVQDDGSGACPNEPLVKKCQDVGIGMFEVYFYTVYYTDTDLSGDLTCGDAITQVTISDPEPFELVALPTLFRLNPDKIDRGNRLKILGWKFGPYQNLGRVRIGSKAEARQNGLNRPGKGDLPLVLNLGKELSTVRSWSSTLIKVKVGVKASWTDKDKYVWIEKDGMKSNYLKLHIN
jgi:hypothetical protein